jgi:hypothetical protein
MRCSHNLLSVYILLRHAQNVDEHPLPCILRLAVLSWT